MASVLPPHDASLDNESQSNTIIIVSITFGLLSTIFTCLRVYTRTHLLGSFWADDWAIVVAQILSIVVSIGTVLEAKYALGKHIWTVPEEDVLAQLKLLYAAIIIYNISMNLVKISLLFLYMRIFQSSVIRRVSICFMVYVILWTVVQVVIVGLACIPLSLIVPSMEDVCLETLPMWMLSSIMSTVTDFAIFIIPLPCVVKLQLRLKKKIMTVLMFCLGFFTCIVSIIRIFSLKTASSDPDPTWANTSAACWSVVELNCAILCSCLPTLRPLIVQVVPGWMNTNNTSTDTYQMYGKSRSAVTRNTQVRTSFSCEDVNVGRDLEDGGHDNSTENLKATTECYSCTPEAANGVQWKDVESVSSVKEKEERKDKKMGKVQILVTRETEVMTKARRSSWHLPRLG